MYFVLELIYFLTHEEVVTVKSPCVLCARTSYSLGRIVAIYRQQALWAKFRFSRKLTEIQYNLVSMRQSSFTHHIITAVTGVLYSPVRHIVPKCGIHACLYCVQNLQVDIKSN